MSEINEALNLLNKQIDQKKDMMFPVEFINKIICDNCISIIKKLPDRCVNLCITDPPWGIDLSTFRKKFKKDSIENDELDEYVKMMEIFPRELFRVMKNNSSIYLFCGGTKPIIKGKSIHWTPYDMMKRFFNAGFLPFRIIVWNKMSPGRGYRYRMKTEFILNMYKGNNPYWEGEGEFKNDIIQEEEGEVEIIEYQKIAGVNKKHISEKPSRIYESFIEDASDVGDLVMDPFAGSGPVIEACKNTARNYLAIEMEKKYIPIMERRSVQMSINEIIYKEEMKEQTKIEAGDSDE